MNSENFDIVKKLNSDFLTNYFDKNNQPIDFDVFYIKDKEESHFSQYIIQANSNGEMAGYISLLFLSKENKEIYFNTCWDFYFNKKMSKHLKNLYLNDWDTFIKEVKNSFDIQIQSKEDFQNWAVKYSENDYKKFLSFYLEKPYPEIVAVYSNCDAKYKDFSEFPFMSFSRRPINFLGNGFGNALYHAACKVLKNDNLELHASNNQTEDGQRMWRQVEKNNNFLVMSDSYLTSLTSDRKSLIEVKRKKLTI